MRLFVSLMTVVLLILVLGFVSTNYDARVGVTFLKTLHEDVPLYAVVLLAIVVGIVYAGGIALAEGAAIRFRNRKLTREVERLERELAYLRTQPAGAPRAEPDALVDSGVSRLTDEPDDDGSPPSSAPVYGDADDDPYTGGRAV